MNKFLKANKLSVSSIAPLNPRLVYFNSASAMEASHTYTRISVRTIMHIIQTASTGP